MEQLSIRKLTLYKQGIGYFERQGQVEGNLTHLVIPRDSINDVLKSLTVIDRAGGQVLGIDYEIPTDKQEVLEELAVKLADRSSMVDLLSSLRGSQVTLHLQGEQTATGRLVGVEASLDQASYPASVLLQTGEDTTQLEVWPVSRLQGLSLHDEQAASDISFFLDLNQAEQTRTSLTIRLSEGNHNLEASYLAPSPNWRVSYRLLGDGEGQARLLGWGLFDNSLGEDLKKVNLTLISGRPISFKSDLHESYIPPRPEVSDDPLSQERAALDPHLYNSVASLSHELRNPLSGIMGYVQILQRGDIGSLTEKQRSMLNTISESAIHMSELLGDLLKMFRLREREPHKEGELIPVLHEAGPLGDLKVSSTYFMPVLMGNAEPENMTYEVEMPVSVQRGQSAMVPILDQPVNYEEICVYNGDKMSNHPLRVWRLQNSTGKALEKGPVTLIDRRRYLGEGLMRFTGVDDFIELPYALEFGLLVTERVERGDKVILAVKFDHKQRRAVVSRYRVTENIYTLTSHVNQDITVLIERRNPRQGTYYEMPTPASRHEGHTRWSVIAPAGEETSFTIRLRTMYDQYEKVEQWTLSFVEELQAAGVLQEGVYNRLKKLDTEKNREEEAGAHFKALRTNYDQVVSRQEQLRKNLETLGQSEREAQIRNRILDDLETSENQRRELEQGMADLSTQLEQHRQQQQTLLEEIYSSSK